MQKSNLIYSLEFLVQVEQDVKDAYDWYQQQAEGLGDDFILSVDAAIHSLHRHPLHYAVVHKSVRQVKTKRFPFGVFFVVIKKTITVIAITHLSRKPATWKKRSRIR